VNFQGVSGLETLFEGTYIAVLPGPTEDDDQYDFKGQVGADSTDPLEDTTTYWLETSNAGSLSAGDAVTFRGLKVGSVTKVELSKDSRLISVQINLQNKYVKLVRTNTVFWRKVAVQAKLGLFNSELKIGSLDSILHGGIDLFTPDEAGPMAKAHAKFDLLELPPKGYEKWNPKLEF